MSVTATHPPAMPSPEEIARCIAERFDPERILLFGSRARGGYDEDSDVDVFVEMESAQRPPERRIAVSSLFPNRTWPMDVIVYTPEEVRRLHGREGTLLATIEAEGRVLYARS